MWRTRLCPPAFPAGRPAEVGGQRTEIRLMHVAWNTRASLTVSLFPLLVLCLECFQTHNVIRDFFYSVEIYMMSPAWHSGNRRHLQVNTWHRKLKTRLLDQNKQLFWYFFWLFFPNVPSITKLLNYDFAIYTCAAVPFPPCRWRQFASWASALPAWPDVVAVGLPLSPHTESASRPPPATAHASWTRGRHHESTTTKVTRVNKTPDKFRKTKRSPDSARLTSFSLQVGSFSSRQLKKWCQKKKWPEMHAMMLQTASH